METSRQAPGYGGFHQSRCLCVRNDKRGIHPECTQTREFESAHIQGAKYLTLQDLEDRTDEVPTTHPVLVHCAGGYRSMIAVSMLKRKGFNNLINVRKGFGGLKTLEGLVLEEGPCPTEKARVAAGV